MHIKRAPNVLIVALACPQITQILDCYWYTDTQDYLHVRCNIRVHTVKCSQDLLNIHSNISAIIINTFELIELQTITKIRHNNTRTLYLLRYQVGHLT